MFENYCELSRFQNNHQPETEFSVSADCWLQKAPSELDWNVVSPQSHDGLPKCWLVFQVTKYTTKSRLGHPDFWSVTGYIAQRETTQAECQLDAQQFVEWWFQTKVFPPDADSGHWPTKYLYWDHRNPIHASTVFKRTGFTQSLQKPWRLGGIGRFWIWLCSLGTATNRHDRCHQSRISEPVPPFCGVWLHFGSVTICRMHEYQHRIRRCWNRRRLHPRQNPGFP